MATQRSALPNNPYLMPSACVNAFLYGSPKGIQLPGTRLNAASIEQPGIQHYPATADTHSPKVIGSSHDATHNQRLNAHWLSRRAPLDRFSSNRAGLARQARSKTIRRKLPSTPDAAVYSS